MVVIVPALITASTDASTLNVACRKVVTAERIASICVAVSVTETPVGSTHWNVAAL